MTKPLRQFGGILFSVLLILFVGALIINSIPVSTGEAQQAATCDQSALAAAQAHYVNVLTQYDAGIVTAEQLNAVRVGLLELIQSCAETIDYPVQIDGGGLYGMLDPDLAEEYVLRGTKWGSGSPFVTPPRLAGGTISYSFMPNGAAIAGIQGESAAAGTSVAVTSFPGYQACFIDDIRAAFAAWSAVANIQFVEVADSGTAFDAAGALGHIRIGGHIFDGASNVLAHAYFPPPLGGQSLEGDLHFDIAENWACAPGSGQFDIGFVALHEIGHSIGLRHEPTILAVMNAFYNPSLTALQYDDMLGAQQIYGPAPGATVFPTYTATFTPSNTPTRTPTPTRTFTPTSTSTFTPTATATATFTPTPTATTNPPPATSLIAPLGSIAESIPSFSWQAVSGTAWYYLWISNTDGTTFSQWYDGGLVCVSSVCTVSPGVTFGAGVQRWWVQTWTLEGGYGPWSTEGTFTAPTPPTTLLAPTGIVTPNPSLTYQWNKVAGVSWYQLWISQPDGTGFSQWYEAGAICGVSTCGVTPSLSYMSGTYRWWVQTWNADSGYGAWSSEANFSIALGTPILVSPINTTTGSLPTYTWQRMTGATWYYLWVAGPGGYVMDSWYQDTVCSVSGCSVTPSVLLTNGAHRWWIQAWSPATGYSPWSAQGDFTVSAASPVTGEDSPTLEATTAPVDDGSAPTLEPTPDIAAPPEESSP